MNRLIFELNYWVYRLISETEDAQMKAANAAALFGMPDIDGGLVGGASLEADEFLGIARA